MEIKSVKDFANASEEEVYDIMFECVGDDDYYTEYGLLSPDALEMHIEVNWPHYFEDCRVRAISEFVAHYVNSKNEVM